MFFLGDTRLSKVILNDTRLENVKLYYIIENKTK